MNHYHDADPLRALQLLRRELDTTRSELLAGERDIEARLATKRSEIAGISRHIAGYTEAIEALSAEQKGHATKNLRAWTDEQEDDDE